AVDCQARLSVSPRESQPACRSILPSSSPLSLTPIRMLHGRSASQLLRGGAERSTRSSVVSTAVMLTARRQPILGPPSLASSHRSRTLATLHPSGGRRSYEMTRPHQPVPRDTARAAASGALRFRSPALGI